MSQGMNQFLSLDLPALLTAVFVAVTCALLGNFLVLRRMSLMGDAISHAVLPGLVVGFLVSGSRSSLPMFLGAAGAGALTVLLVNLVRRLGRIEPGAAMGVVFTVLFALGVLLIERAAARGVDLDADCVFNGQLERVFWFAPSEWSALLDPGVLKELPRQLWTSAAMLVVAAVCVALFFKELRICSFDPALAASVGIDPRIVNGGLMLLVAAAVVAAFEAVGSILVIAMLICPAATCRLLTDRLYTQVWMSAIVAAAVGAGGYFLAAHAPAIFGTRDSLSAAGMMSVAAGVLLAAAVFAAPEHGLVARALRRRRTARDTRREDVLATIFRLEELAGRARPVGREEIAAALGAQREGAWRAGTDRAIALGQIVERDGKLELTEAGRRTAGKLVRAHRLWETYLVNELGLRPDHVHERAETLEHVTDPAMSEALKARLGTTGTDPHGKRIPDIGGSDGQAR